MNNRNSCCDIKLIHSAWKNGNSASTFFPSLSTLTLAQTLTQITGVGFVGGWGAIFHWAFSRGEAIFQSWWQFYGTQFSGNNLNSAFQTKINATSFVE